MGKKLKKGTRGTAAQYLTRAAALKRLQLSLADFRRLCILKGVYPRDPKKKLKGKDKTYYHAKDVVYLYHEPLLQKFRDLRVFERKYRRAIGRGESSIARSLQARRPVYGLFHLVKERYPTLLDAVKDLDDALSTIALFASLSASDEKAVDADTVAEATRLFDEMLLYIAKKQILRKIFVSIKGYYIQIKLIGQLVTFLLPHQFPQDLPAEVDFKVLKTFVEFYTYVLKTVNFKLYLMSNFLYPPAADFAMVKAGCRFLALSTEDATAAAPEVSAADATPANVNSRIESLNKKLSKRRSVDDEKEEEEEEEEEEDAALMSGTDENPEKFEDDSTLDQIQEVTKDEQRLQRLFSECTFFVSREVPRVPMILCLMNCGAAGIGWQGEGSPLEEHDPKITHHILDRPLTDALKTHATQREFVQPQWVFDSLNSTTVLPIAPYYPGTQPPPHLSPFVNDAEVGYVPEQRLVLTELSREAVQRETESLAKEDEDVEDIEIEEEKFQRELQAERANEETIVVDDDIEARSEKKKKQKNAEEIERRKALLSKKHKRLLERIEYGHERKKEKVAALERKRKSAISK